MKKCAAGCSPKALPLSAFDLRSDTGKPRSYCRECQKNYIKNYRSKHNADRRGKNWTSKDKARARRKK